MKKNLLLVLFAVIAIVFTSCSKDEDIVDENKDKNNPETTYLTAKDVKGVWTKNGNDLYFILLTENGRYSFCFDNQVMGSGTYVLDKNNIIFTNGYLHTVDELEISLKNGNININGDITLFKEEKSKSVNLIFSKSNENCPKSMIGEKYASIGGLSMIYGNTREYVYYNTEYLANYKYIQDNALQKVIKDENWFYVYRNEMTYTQKINGAGEVIIYKLQPRGVSDSIINQ